MIETVHQVTLCTINLESRATCKSRQPLGDLPECTCGVPGEYCPDQVPGIIKILTEEES